MDKIKGKMANILLNSSCSSPKTKNFLENGIKMTHSYYKENGVFLFKVNVSLNKCAALKK